MPDRYLPRRDLLSLEGNHSEVLRLRCRMESEGLRQDVDLRRCVRGFIILR